MSPASTEQQPTHPPRAGGPVGAAGPAGASSPTRRLVPGQVHVGELISAVSALALLVILFATEWYGVAGVPDPSAARPAVSIDENGWNGLSIVRWVILLTVVVAIGSVVLHATQRHHGNRTETSLAVFGLGLLTSLLLIYRVLIALPSPDKVLDQKLGAFVGLMCALGVTLGGHESLTEQRDHRREARAGRAGSASRVRSTAAFPGPAASPASAASPPPGEERP